jgi:hypothetical protein
MGLLVAQGTSPLRLAVGVVAFPLAVISVTPGDSDRRQGGEAGARHFYHANTAAPSAMVSISNETVAAGH